MFLRVGIFYVLTWFFLILLGGIQQATGILPPQIGLAQWGPGIAAFLMLVLFRKDDFKITFFSKNTPFVRYLLAAVIPAGVGLVVFLLRNLVPMESSTPDVYNKMALVLLWTPLVLWVKRSAGGDIYIRDSIHESAGYSLRYWLVYYGCPFTSHC